ncbi:hypothetical protein KQX54_011061 [Cotesia glomerata]|uniref:Uncharacterized protein n=1 Tax=Cotesia glomerata TaxID=32391 RepID=A0AAV7IES1_COTGL|nr:hypothetical protein KQX54_011061 [Cotesia glomerata]
MSKRQNEESIEKMQIYAEKLKKYQKLLDEAKMLSSDKDSDIDINSEKVATQPEDPGAPDLSKNVSPKPVEVIQITESDESQKENREPEDKAEDLDPELLEILGSKNDDLETEISDGDNCSQSTSKEPQETSGDSGQPTKLSEKASELLGVSKRQLKDQSFNFHPESQTRQNQQNNVPNKFRLDSRAMTLELTQKKREHILELIKKFKVPGKK